jgi:hypothetical protein
VKPLLQPITAFHDSSEDLYQGWLGPCHDATHDSEVAHVIRQYRQLILKLGINAMNTPLMEKYYHLMQDQDRYEAALSLISMMNDLPAFRCQKLIYEFQNNHYPFSSLWLCNPTLAVFEGLPIEEGSGIKIHVATSSGNATVVQFWDQNDDLGKLPKQILQNLGMIDSFQFSEGWFSMEFDFPNKEEGLYQFMREFMLKLKTLSPNIA